MVTIDAHVHAHLRGNHIGNDPARGPDWDGPAETLLERMEASGVDKAVLVPINPHPDNHQYLADCIAKYPGRFAAVGVHDPDAPDPGADYARRADAYRLQGTRVKDLLADADTPVEELFMFPLLAELERRGHNLWLFGQAADIPQLPRILDRLPDLKVGLNLMGYPSAGGSVAEDGRPHRRHAGIPPVTLPGVLELAAYENVHVMLGGLYQFSLEPHPHKDLGDVVRALFEAYGAQRCFWASDWPWIEEIPGYKVMPDIIDANLPNLSADARAEIFGGTASRLFDFS